MSSGSKNGKPHKPQRLAKKNVYLVASGDLRLSANQKCWPAQKAMEDALTLAGDAVDARIGNQGADSGTRHSVDAVGGVRAAVDTTTGTGRCG